MFLVFSPFLFHDVLQLNGASQQKIKQGYELVQ